MSDVFISYSRLDREFVSQLREALIRQQQDVWIDWESIPPSQTWWNEIQKGIARANNFVVILSPNSVASPICQMEIEYARQLKKRIIPVLYADYNRDESLRDIAKRLATSGQEITRQLWGTRQPYDLFDANEAELKHINYFFFKADADFQSRFDDLLGIIHTDFAHKEKHTTLGLRAAEWDRRNRDASFLLLDSELADAEAWLAAAPGKAPPATDLQRAYIAASAQAQAAREQQEAAIQSHLKELRHDRIGLTIIASITVALVIVAGYLLILSFRQIHETDIAFNAQLVVATNVFGTLTPIPQTIAAAQSAAQSAQQQVQVAASTLTPIPPTLTALAKQNNSLHSIVNVLGVNLDPAQEIAAISTAIADNPTFVLSYVVRGYLYERIGDSQHALADYNQAIALDPNADAYIDRGAFYDTHGQPDQALLDYNQALALDPNNVLALNNRGLVYDTLGQPDKALADYDRAISINPHYAAAYTDRGSVYDEQGLYDKALADYNQAIALDANDAKAYTNRGSLYSKQGQLDKALADFNQAIALDPNDALIYNERGIAYAKNKQYDKALIDFNQAVALNPKYALAYYNRGNIYYLNGKYDEALMDYNQAIVFDPKYGPAYNNRGLVYYKMGQYDKALADFLTYKQLTGSTNADPIIAQLEQALTETITPTGSPTPGPTDTPTPTGSA